MWKTRIISAIAITVGFVMYILGIAKFNDTL